MNYHSQRYNRNRYNRNRKSRFNSTPSIPHSRYINSAVPSFKKEEYNSVYAFEDFPINPVLKQNIKTHGYLIPTPIQDQAIMPILNGRDVIGIANTGTGKTAAFLIPLIHKLTQKRLEKVLIITPTRELAVQINEEIRVFSKNLHLLSVLFIGGVSINRQISDLSRNPDIIIGTPGRLKDLIMRRILSVSGYKNIVLDEVDRMVDIGFIQDIRYIISNLSKVRQSLFFSATVTFDVKSIINSFVKDAITISVKIQETASGIEQNIIKVNDKNEKIQKLVSLLGQEEFKKVLIFGRTKWGVERLSRTLFRHGILVGSIHGNKSQNQRLRVLMQFKQNQLKALVATDVAARGLDIDNVSHVINFDEPASYTDYIHRIGRTGRAQRTGKALTFVG